MLGGSKVVVGLDIGSWAVKAVALQPTKDRLSLLGYAHQRVEDNDPSLVIRRVIDQLGLKPKRLVTAVSGRSVIVRQVETPKLNDDELKAHIAYEADKYIPFGADEVVLDCQALPSLETTENANQQVLLVAVRRGFIEDHLSLVQSAGLIPEIIDVDVFALCNAFWTLGPNPAAGLDGATALVDIGAAKTWVAIVGGNRPLFQREIYLAGNEITDAIARSFNEEPADVENVKITAEGGESLEAMVDAAMSAFEDLANEIRLSFDYVEGQFETEVSTVVLTGGSAQLPTVADILGNILGRPVRVFDPLAGLDLVPSRYDIHGLDANSPSLAVALGLAAHILDVKAAGLGGTQSQAWQPRQTREGGVPTPMPRNGPAVPAAPGEMAMPEPAGALPPPAPLHPAPAPIMTPPPPAIVAPPAAPIAPPPAAIAMPPPARFPTPKPVGEPGTSQIIASDEASRSGLLVVLDDDQDIPAVASERLEKGTGTVSQPRQSVRIEEFDEDEGDQPKLPQLPPLPK